MSRDRGGNTEFLRSAACSHGHSMLDFEKFERFERFERPLHTFLFVCSFFLQWECPRQVSIAVKGTWRKKGFISSHRLQSRREGKAGAHGRNRSRGRGRMSFTGFALHGLLSLLSYI